MKTIMHRAASSLSILAALASGTAIVALPASAAEPHSCTEPAAESAEAAACELAGMLERMFIDPATGARYAAVLREGVASGRYAMTDKEAAARTLTADLQAAAPDGHLKVQVPLPRKPAAQPAPGQEKGAPQIPLVEQPGWIAPGIAYIRINQFAYDDAETQQVAQFMRDHASARALIFDLRTNRGGGLSQMDVIFPWLFAEPTRLLTMEMRKSAVEEHGNMFEGIASVREIAEGGMVHLEHWAAPNGETGLQDAKVYVLVGPRTHSAAEHFAMAMKASHRAVLVGEPTSGANHFGGRIELPGGLVAFLPIGRTTDPQTGEDWETKGVMPDVVVPKEEALERALLDLGLSASEARTLSDSRKPSWPMERRVLR